MRLRLNLWVTAVVKELTVCFRDPDVFIYSVLLPALLYPVLLFFASELMLWHYGSTEKMKVRVAADRQPVALVNECLERLKKERNIVCVTPSDPTLALFNEELDAVIGYDSKAKRINITYKSTSPASSDAKEKLREFFDKWQTDRLKARLATQPKDWLKVFTAQSIDVAPSINAPAPTAKTDASAEDESKPSLGSVRMIFCVVLCLICSSMAYGGIAPAVCLFTEEREKQTLPTTLMLPVNRAMLVASKLFTIASIALCSGLINLINLILVGLLLINQTRAIDFSKIALMLNETVPLPILAELALLLTAFAVTTASLFAVTATWAKDYSHAYNLLTFPLLWAAVLPLVGALPVVHQMEVVTWLPVANLAFQIADLLNRNPLTNHMLIALIENSILTVFNVALVARLFSSERILLTGSAD